MINDKTLTYILLFLIILTAYLCFVKMILFKESVVLHDNNILHIYRLDRKLNLNNNIELSQIFKDSIDALQIRVSKTKKYINSDFILFESYDLIDQHLNKLYYPTQCKYIYAIKNTDSFVSKYELYKNYSDVYNKEIIKYYLPETYINITLDKLKSLNYNKNIVYIAKKNIQQQQGLILFNSYKDISDKYDSNIVVVQQMLQNPFLVNNRKINIRIYLLIVVKNNDIKFYIYNDGFMYYTPKHFVKYSLNPDNVITTGYIDRSVYKNNPLTYKDFKKFLGKQHASTLQKNIISLFTGFKEVYAKKLLFSNKELPGTKFLVYGCDIAPDEYLNCKLIEINKGPDLTYKDDRDRNVKLEMMKDVFRLVNITEYSNIKSINTGNNFISI